MCVNVYRELGEFMYMKAFISIQDHGYDRETTKIKENKAQCVPYATFKLATYDFFFTFKICPKHI